MKRFVSLILALLMLSHSVGLVQALSVPLDEMCCREKVRIYDESGEETEGLLPTGSGSNCRSEVDLDKFDFDDHKSAYHTFLDEQLFARALSKVSSFEKSQDLLDYLQAFDGKCQSGNHSPDCLSERVLCSYEKYGKTLFDMSGQPLANEAISTQNTDQLLQVLQERQAEIFQEATAAEQALDSALTIYSQFFETYRIHLSLKNLIDSLVRVRNLSAFLRQLVNCFPNKFGGVSTTKCN